MKGLQRFSIGWTILCIAAWVVMVVIFPHSSQIFSAFITGFIALFTLLAIYKGNIGNLQLITLGTSILVIGMSFEAKIVGQVICTIIILCMWIIVEMAAYTSD